MIIKIKNLKLITKIGIYEYEETFDRSLILNIKIKTFDEKAVLSDDIKDAIDYDVIVKKVTDIVNTKRFKLIEGLAGSIISAILEDKGIERCKLEIDKVGIINNSDSTSVTLERFN